MSRRRARTGTGRPFIASKGKRNGKPEKKCPACAGLGCARCNGLGSKRKSDDARQRVEKASLKHRVRLRSQSPTVARESEKADIFSSQKFDDGSALTSLTSDERECIVTMIDFFRSSGEEEHLDPEVYEALAQKLGAGREPEKSGRYALPQLQRQLQGLTRALFELAHETVGLVDSKPDPETAQGALWRDAIEAFDTCQRVIGGLIVEENEEHRYDSWRDELKDSAYLDEAGYAALRARSKR